MAIRLIILIIVFTFNFSCIDKDKTIYTAYDHPQIVYSGYQWWNYDIISVDIFGNDFSHITKNEWADTGPIVSPDGSQLIFASDRDGNREIYSMNIAFVGGYYNWVGENLKNISQDPYFDGDYSFSPDGEKILYLKYYPENDNYDIFLMNNDGSDKKNISNTPWYEKKPMFSPDGTNIIYQSWQYNNVEIFFTHILEGNQVNITKSIGDDIIHWGNTFSPNGNQIIFSSNRDGNSEIYISDISGKNQKNLSNNENWDSEPQFSILGDQIIFSSNRDGNSEIYIMNIDGSNLKNLSQNKARDWNPKVYPDNRKIVFMSDRDDNWEIYIMDFDGSNQINLSNNPRTDFSFSFLPLPN